MSFTIDGIRWKYPCTIERVAEVTPSEISGMLLNKQYFNDVLGTWLKYKVTLAIPKGQESEYSEIFEILSNPKDAHTFILPYNESEVTITARVQTVSDVFVRLPHGKQTWRRTTFEIVANHPSKTMSLDQVLTVGMTPIPESLAAQIGDIYQYTQGGWIQRFYGDGDNISY